jgi:hypothetical protein
VLAYLLEVNFAEQKGKDVKLNDGVSEEAVSGSSGFREKVEKQNDEGVLVPTPERT